MKIKKEDQVLIIAGDEKGKKGKVLKSMPSENKAIIEGVNLAKKHIRPKQKGQKGQIVKIPMPMNVSKLKVVCPKCGQASKIGYDVSGEVKSRICKKCNAKL
ncbi:MAG: 50S ribosomal protein L24 [Candidatus Pacebacteria bacterium]|nr:50S ribosomal protein L24 [Candidatus Paceibacterota bacterium]